MKLLRRSRSVRCVDCGYACLRVTEEIFLGDSEVVEDWKHPEYRYVTRFDELAMPLRSPQLSEPPKLDTGESELCCYRQAFPLWIELKQIREGSSEDNGLLLAAYKHVLNAERDCKFWFTFSPGYGPELHRDLEQRHRDRTSERLWNFASVAFGAALVAIPTIIIALVK